MGMISETKNHSERLEWRPESPLIFEYVGTACGINLLMLHSIQLRLGTRYATISLDPVALALL